MDFIWGCIRNMFRKKLRTILTISGIGIGVMSVVIISLIGDVGKASINQELNSMGISGLCVTASNDMGSKLFSDTELEMVRENQNVRDAAPLITQIANVKARGMTTQAVLWGMDEHTSNIVSIQLLHGRMLRKSDVSAGAEVCLVDQSFADLLYHRDNIVGKTIQLMVDGKYRDYTVVGVVSAGGNLLQSLMGEIVPTFVYLPYSSLTRYSADKNFAQIVAQLNPYVDEETAEASITVSLSKQIAGTGRIQIENLNQQKDKLNGILNLVTLILSAIGGISLIVAGLSIMTVMLVTVHERTREIGIKKSIGASRRIILFEFLTEALLLSLVGSLLGSTAGLLIGAVGCGLLGVTFLVQWETIGICILFSVLIGMIFGVYPAMKASKLKPVEALRYE